MSPVVFGFLSFFFLVKVFSLLATVYDLRGRNRAFLPSGWREECKALLGTLLAVGVRLLDPELGSEEEPEEGPWASRKSVSFGMGTLPLFLSSLFLLRTAKVAVS